MTTGFALKGMCWGSAETARAVQCQDDYPQSGSTGSSSYVVSCIGTTSTGLTLERSEPAASAVTYEVATSYPACSMGVIGRSPFDGAQAIEAFAWGFTGVLFCYLVAWGVGRVLGAIWSR